MSNTKAWRSKPRTTKPNSRQKRNGLFLDAHPACSHCGAEAKQAHHDLPHGHPQRNLWEFMTALCVDCHVVVHQPKPQSCNEQHAALRM